MAFTDFKSADEVQKAYQISYIETDFITFTPRALPEYFVREFEFNRENFDIFGSEASRCEAVIYPILREACKSFIRDYSLWSHKSISADAMLTGTPDYVVAKRSQLGNLIRFFPVAIDRQTMWLPSDRNWEKTY